jgi:hypothetical protein
MKGSTLGSLVMALAHRFIIFIIAFLFLSHPGTAQNDDNTNWTEKGGYSVVMEQYTATWCDVCASVDSWMPRYTEANGNRVIRVAFHDSIDDPLGTEITDYRLAKYSDTLVAPSFWFDGKITSGGAPDTTTLHRSLLSAENNRRGDTDINLNVSLKFNELIITAQLSKLNNTENSKILFMILEDNVIITENINSNGIKVHNDVVFAYNEIHNNHSHEWSHPRDSWAIMPSMENEFISKFLIPEGKSFEDIEIVVIHESFSTNGSNSKILGAVSIHLGNESTIDKMNIFIPFLVILCVSALPILIQSRR